MYISNENNKTDQAEGANRQIYTADVRINVQRVIA